MLLQADKVKDQDAEEEPQPASPRIRSCNGMGTERLGGECNWRLDDFFDLEEDVEVQQEEMLQMVVVPPMNAFVSAQAFSPRESRMSAFVTAAPFVPRNEQE